MMRAWLPGLVFFLMLAVRLAEPVLDGDLFWHMAYAQQMLARHTLIPDHTLYSWTPSETHVLYCAWLAELALLGIWKVLGLSGIFILRYAVVLGIVALWHDLARRCHVGRGLVFWLIVLVAFLASYVGTLPKPEMFSLLFFNVLVWIIFRAKLAAARGAASTRWLCAMPALFLVWVNTHGAFIISAPLLAALAIGEFIHARRGNVAGALPMRPLLICVALCAAASMCTPYGLAYPRYLIVENVLRDVARPDAGWNAAYQNIFTLASWFIPFPVFLLTMLVLFIAAVWHHWRVARRGADCTALLAFVLYVPLFLIYLRTTFFLPAVFVAGTFYFLRDGEERRAKMPFSGRLAQSLASGALAVFSLFTLHQIFLRPLSGAWCGFGVGGTNPAEEAEFLARRKTPDPRLINLFNTGGYLLWRLWPQYEVMVDSRSFPYLSWFNDQFRFGHGASFDAFTAKYPAPVAIIDMDRTAVWENFLFSKDWQPIFYGRAAVVFQRARPGIEAPLETPPDSTLRGQRSAGSALHLFTFARLIADYRVAWLLEKELQRPPLCWQLGAKNLRGITAYHAAHTALRAGQFDQADALFREALINHAASESDKLILSLLEVRKKAGANPALAEEHAKIEAGLLHLAAPVP